MSALSPFRDEVELARTGGLTPFDEETWYPRESSGSPSDEADHAEQGLEQAWGEGEEEDEPAPEQEDEAPAHPIMSLFRLPAAALAALSGGLPSVAVGLAMAAGYRDVNQLTNIVFYFRHPELIGKKIEPGQRELAAEWIAIRDRVVKPALQSTGTSGAPAARPPATSSATGRDLSSSQLVWPGASADQLTFMRAVYDQQVARAKRSRTFVADLPRGALDPVEGPGYRDEWARKDAAAAVARLLADARAALIAQSLAAKIKIGVISAYRPASKQFEIWQGRSFSGKPRRGGFPAHYAIAIRDGVIDKGDFSPAAVQKMAGYISGLIAAPGYSNHQDGLAFDLGTTEGGKSLRTLGWNDWFRKWLKAGHEAGTHPFQPLATEAWHWTYRPRGQSEAWAEEAAAGAGAVQAGGIQVPQVPLLARHRGTAPALILRWNAMPAAPAEIDVVVHLHGYAKPGMRLDRDIEPFSGLDLAPVGGAQASGRARPTLTVLPRGHDTGVRTKSGLIRYTFPALVPADALPQLVRFALERFAAETGGPAPRVARLILTAHSGGGAPLLQILRHHDPHEVHVFDGLYQDASRLAAWARRRIQRDRADAGSDARAYMQQGGGALRVFYRGPTRAHSLGVLRAISSGLGSGLGNWYRVEESTLGHWRIPREYGWRILADASADVPGARSERPAARESFEEWGESPVDLAEVQDFDEVQHEADEEQRFSSTEDFDGFASFADEGPELGADDEAAFEEAQEEALADLETAAYN